MLLLIFFASIAYAIHPRPHRFYFSHASIPPHMTPLQLLPLSFLLPPFYCPSDDSSCLWSLSHVIHPCSATIWIIFKPSMFQDIFAQTPPTTRAQWNCPTELSTTPPYILYRRTTYSPRGGALTLCFPSTVLLLVPFFSSLRNYYKLHLSYCIYVYSCVPGARTCMLFLLLNWKHIEGWDYVTHSYILCGCFSALH